MQLSPQVLAIPTGPSFTPSGPGRPSYPPIGPGGPSYPGGNQPWRSWRHWSWWASIQAGGPGGPGIPRRQPWRPSADLDSLEATLVVLVDLAFLALVVLVDLAFLEVAVLVDLAFPGGGPGGPGGPGFPSGGPGGPWLSPEEDQADKDLLFPWFSHPLHLGTCQDALSSVLRLNRSGDGMANRTPSC